ncbi:major facilitator superfamily permease [Klebsiella pneumoniae]|uniref:Major facilitator superfamily permease n=1 Tax=Klebsiella pneumoniae TaxID=573 RepID=A0A2X3CY49_KLEPN|nr:major facilitator superfamily permease [Klebsiella pneumoniae]
MPTPQRTVAGPELCHHAGVGGPILGPVLGGVFVTWASWHWIFLINIPIGVIGILYARKYMPNFTTPRRRFDIGGFLLFGLSLVLFSSGIELFGKKSWRHGRRWP